MPLPTSTSEEVLNYCKRDLPDNFEWYRDEFDFVADNDLQEELAKAFYSSRYIYKLMEGLAISGNELHAHLKFQIMQYASIYEAVINYLLLNRYKEHTSVQTIQLHKAYRPIAALASPTKLTYEGNETFICLHKDAKTPWTSISFQDKVNAASDIGLIDEQLGEEIKEFYRLRNSVHIEAAAKRGIDYEVKEAKLAYRRMRPFIDQIKEKISLEAAEMPMV
jgi:hypothetical protein